jgi:X-X-X-Leu-X-X-Gly heptad repeat protein
MKANFSQLKANFSQLKANFSQLKANLSQLKATFSQHLPIAICAQREPEAGPHPTMPVIA